MIRLFFISVIFLFFRGFSVYCQPESVDSSKSALIINKFSQSVVFDGIPDEEAWKEINPVKLTMHAPVFGKEPSEKTDVRIAYDDKYMYAGAILYYKDRSLMRTASLKRDYLGAGTDWFGLLFDTYNDKENSLAFFTTPDGLRMDAAIQKDAVVTLPDQMPMNLNWNTFWDVLTRQDSTGWSLELRIPISSLRFQERNGEVRMGMTIERWIPAKNESNIFPAIPPNWGPNSIMKPSQAKEIVFKGLKPDKPLYIAPYALTGYESNYEINADNTDYLKSDKPKIEAGLDIKYGLSKTLVMDLTVNTDFAQVESDDQKINLTRYSLYFPEKRMFFLERASIFDFSLGGNSNLFYSRRIGLYEDEYAEEPEPEPVRIYGGARITGRIRDWEVGFLDMQTAPLWKNKSAENELMLRPSENFGVMRFRRQVFNENSYMGTMVTSRLGADGSYNLAYGLDGTFKVYNDDYFNVRWSQTFEEGIANKSLSEPTFFMALWERRSVKGLGYDIGYTQSGTHFNPDIGFEILDDYSLISGGVRYGWISPEKSKIYSHGPEVRLMYRKYIDNGDFMNFINFTGWKFQTKDQWQARGFFVYNDDNLRDTLEIITDELYIPKGRYNYASFWVEGATPMSKHFYLMLMTEIGQFYDGNRISVRLQPTWNLSKHFELGGSYNFDHVTVSKRNVSMTNHIVGVKALYMMNIRLSVNAYIQYNTAVNEIVTNLRLRYNPREGNDLYIVYDGGRNTDLTREEPNLPPYNSRSVMLKYTYTFNL
jgi:hypothetical protein